jgi:hypothetical protein
LWEFQAGYRWNGNTGEPSPDWLNAWVVIASLGGDPFSFHRRTGVILYDICGRGKWEPQFVFDDLYSMAGCIAELGLIYKQAQDGLWDDDWRLMPEYRTLATIDSAIYFGRNLRPLFCSTALSGDDSTLVQESQ